MEDGYVTINNLSSDVAYLTTKEFDETNDYLIEIKIRRSKADSESKYGLVWGSQSSSNSYEFQLFEDSYRIVKYVNGKAETLTRWWKVTSIKESFFIVLKIIKTFDGIRFYINNVYIDKIDYQSFLGYKHGISLYGNITLKMHYFRIIGLKKL